MMKASELVDIIREKFGIERTWEVVTPSGARWRYLDRAEAIASVSGMPGACITGDAGLTWWTYQRGKWCEADNPARRGG